MKKSLELEFDGAVYELEAVQNACYRFTNIAAFDIREIKGNGRHSFVITIWPLSTQVDADIGNIENRIRNEVLDQQLRRKIRTQTEGVRNLILAYAFSKTGLISDDDKTTNHGKEFK